MLKLHQSTEYSFDRYSHISHETFEQTIKHSTLLAIPLCFEQSANTKCNSKIIWGLSIDLTVTFFISAEIIFLHCIHFHGYHRACFQLLTILIHISPCFSIVQSGNALRCCRLLSTLRCCCPLQVKHQQQRQQRFCTGKLIKAFKRTQYI